MLLLVYKSITCLIVRGGAVRYRTKTVRLWQILSRPKSKKSKKPQLGMAEIAYKKPRIVLLSEYNPGR